MIHTINNYWAIVPQDRQVSESIDFPNYFSETPFKETIIAPASSQTQRVGAPPVLTNLAEAFVIPSPCSTISQRHSHPLPVLTNLAEAFVIPFPCSPILQRHSYTSSCSLILQRHLPLVIPFPLSSILQRHSSPLPVLTNFAEALSGHAAVAGVGTAAGQTDGLVAVRSLPAVSAHRRAVLPTAPVAAAGHRPVTLLGGRSYRPRAGAS